MEPESTPSIVRPNRPPPRREFLPEKQAAPPEVCYRKILTPIDFSEASLGALDYAVCFAERFQARLVLLHVLEPTASGGYLALASIAQGLNSPAIESKCRDLEKLSRKHVSGRVACEALVRLGRPPTEIPGTAKALGIDLIILGTFGHGSGKPLVVGCTAECVVRHAPCPVLVVPVSEARLNGGSRQAS